jgi:dimethylamine/trimethylamine dehydrogenase
VPPKGSASRVLVVGGGPAGLEAARVAGARGYDVALAEAGSELGGHLNAVARLPGLAEWARVRDWRLGQIGRMTNVEVYRDSRLDAAQVLEFGFEHVIVATGSRWRRDGVGTTNFHPVPGFGSAHVLTPEDVMAGAEVQSPVVIFDDDPYVMGGCLAELLAELGHQVTVVTPHPQV